MNEADLFPPLKTFFEDRGAQVYAEVRGNDGVVVQDGLYFGLELKKTFNLELVYQLLQRRGLFHGQYGVIPVHKGTFKNRSKALMLLSALGFGLIGVEFLQTKTRVSIILQCSKRAEPLVIKGKSRVRMISEIANRFLEFGHGGVSSGSAFSAYRQRALFALWLVQVKGNVHPKDLDLCFPGQRVGRILQQNVYGWFFRINHGTYGATDAGLRSFSAYHEQIESMMTQWQELLSLLED